MDSIMCWQAPAGWRWNHSNQLAALVWLSGTSAVAGSGKLHMKRPLARTMQAPELGVAASAPSCMLSAQCCVWMPGVRQLGFQEASAAALRPPKDAPMQVQQGSKTTSQAAVHLVQLLGALASELLISWAAVLPLAST